jgi:phytoene dehydrogenase-like protein
LGAAQRSLESSDSELRNDTPADAQALAATLAAAERGDTRATAELFTTLYGELHRLARQQLHANAWGAGTAVGAVS